MSEKGKLIFAFLYACGIALVPILDGGRKPGPADVVAVAIAVVTAVGIYITPLIPTAAWTKTGVGVMLAGLQAAIPFVDGWPLSASEWMIVAFAVAGALGIAVAPAGSDNGVRVGWGGDSRVA